MKGTKIFLRNKKNKKQKHSLERYKNLSENKKKMLAQCRKRYQKIQKNKCLL